MLRPLILVAALGLTACAAPAANPIVYVPAQSADLVCNAGDVVQCPVGGCTSQSPGERSALPISLEVPAHSSAGRFCIATGCEDATFAPRPSSTGFGYTMRTNDRTEYTSALDIALDQHTFTLSEANDGGTSVWTGTCSAAGS